MKEKGVVQLNEVIVSLLQWKADQYKIAFVGIVCVALDAIPVSPKNTSLKNLRTPLIGQCVV